MAQVARLAGGVGGAAKAIFSMGPCAPRRTPVKPMCTSADLSCHVATCSGHKGARGSPERGLDVFFRVLGQMYGVAQCLHGQQSCP